MSAIANVAGTNVITIAAQSLALGGANLAGLSSTSSFNTAAAASTFLSAINTALNKTNRVLATMGAQYKAVALHNTFMAKLQDNLDSGVGNLVDADLGRESARLQSLQSRQQLGVQAASIANQSTSALLGLFR